MKKEDIQALKISNYNYNLPHDRIAKYPIKERDKSRLLLFKDSHIDEAVFKDLPNHIPAGSLMIFNNTRVIHGRLVFKKKSGARIEIFCLNPYLPADYESNLSSTNGCEWSCLIGNARRWKDGELSMDVNIGEDVVKLKATKIKTEGSYSVIRFDWDRIIYTFSQIIEGAGRVPIPPYLERESEECDVEGYQTTYSSVDGSVAAPTAGLHFTKEVLDELAAKGVEMAEVTLHVGAGTFRPVKSDTIGGHDMHREFISVTKDTIKKIAEAKGKIIVVGTTSMRTMESLYYAGKKVADKSSVKDGKVMIGQWEPYDEVDPISPKQAMINILDYLESRGEDHLIGETELMIAPGYKFHYADAIITNFHQPESTLLLLISAFVGDVWRDIYDYALKNNFRFLSYGDTSLLWNNEVS
ncbi:MAG: S-adenosylmethionine:tRNA ribosyltransferase-isomerase [Fermentimonas sp.]|jgi:S-adenosylmethionine:tRNA ribosyltransferase-isomerase